MKRKLLLLAMSLMLISSVFLAACSSDQGSDNTDKPQTQEPGESATGNDGNASEELDGWIKATDKSKIPAAALNRDDTVIIGMTEPAGIFNPWFYSTSYDRYVIDAMFESLLDYDFDGTLQPALAKEYDIAEDGLTYTFHLRDDVKFSDGTPLTAYDAEFSYYIYADPAYDGNSDLSKAAIKGWDEYKKGDAETIEGVKVLDDHTLQIEVTEARATTLANIAVAVLPKHYYSEGYTKGNLDAVKALNQKPLGSGPFVFDRFIQGQEVRLVANENYHGGAPKISSLIYKATTNDTNIASLQTGDTDFEEGISVNADNVELLKSLGFLDMNLLPNNGYGYIAFNHKLPKFQDVRVRQALTYGLNREDIVYAYSQGYSDVINVPQSKVSWAYPDEDSINAYEYNPEKANQLLDEAGWEMGPDGYRYKDGEKFVIYFAASSPNEVNDAIIPYATENYKELGIEFVPEQLEFNAVVEKRNSGNFEMMFMAWGLTPEPDPTNVFHTNGSQNKDGYSNPKVDELIEAGLKELDQEKRKEIYHELYQVMNEDLPYIFMYQRKNMNTVNARLQGFEMSPYRYFSAGLQNVEVAETK